MIVLAIGVAPNRTKRHDRRAAAIIGLQVIRGVLCRGLVPHAGRHDVQQGGAMAKRYGRPSAQYRYEHYDPRM